MFGFPDIVGFYAMLYGTAGIDLQGLTVFWFGGASGQVFCGNPPYTVTDFLGFYPKFFGPASNFSGLAYSTGDVLISGFTDVSTLLAGQLVVNPAFTKDTIIVSVDSTNKTITVSNAAISDGTILTVYTTPIVPIVVISTFITLALASVMSQRYNEMWTLMMGWFVAHYLTLYLRSENVPADADVSQITSSGLTKGILVQRAAGDVSAMSKLLVELNGFAEWGAWNETQYGEQFITVARATNCGPVYVL